MAPCTIGGLAGQMAHDGHFQYENYEFTGIGGPAPTSAFGHILDLCFGDLDPAVCVEHALRTACSGSIPEFTYIWGASTLSRHQSWPSPLP